MFGLANAISFARLTARGQCGQVGVENTRIVTGVPTADTRWRFASVKLEPCPPTSRIACTSETNSYPLGAPRNLILESRTSPLSSTPSTTTAGARSIP